MKKNRNLFISLVVLLLIAVSALAWMFLSSGGSGPELALPKAGSNDIQILVKLENPAVFKDKLQKAAGLLGKLSKGTPLPDSVAEIMRDLVMDEVIRLTEVAEQAAFLLVASEGENDARYYLSFIPNAEAWNGLISGSSSRLVSIEKWEQNKGAEGWIMKLSNSPRGGGSDSAPLYLLKSGTGRSAPVLASNRPDLIDEMQKALKSGSSRLDIKRHNPAPDYMQARFPVKTPSGEAKAAVSEIAWIEDKTSAHAQFYSDAFALMTGRAVPKSGIRGEDLPFLGNGDLLFVAAVDIPYACFMSFPLESDPIGKVLSMAGPLLPEGYKEDIRAVMANGRISTVVVGGEEGREKPDTAYFVLESKETDALNRALALVKMFMTRGELPGWDSCFTTELWGGDEIILAQRGNILLLGVGSLESYKRKARIPGEIKDFAAPRDLANLVATPPFWRSVLPIIKGRMAEKGIDPSLFENTGVAPMKVQLRVITPEKMDLGFYWKPAEK